MLITKGGNPSLVKLTQLLQMKFHHRILPHTGLGFPGKMIYFSFFNRPLVYGSTESVQELKQIYMETRQEEEREVQQRKKEQKKEKKGGDVNVVKKKAIRMGIVTVVMIVLGAAAAVWYKMYR